MKRCSIAWLAVVALACEPEPVSTTETEAEAVTETQAAPQPPVAPEPQAAPRAPSPPPRAISPPPPVLAVADGGDVAVSSGPLAPSRGEHAFPIAHDCRLARAELDYEIEGRPAGTITLRTASGLEAREGMRVLTTPRFVRTWDWARLADLHPARGTSTRGTWTTTYALAEVPRPGDAFDPRAPQRILDVDLRLWCETPAVPATEPEIHGHVEVEARAPRPGANLRAMLAVTRACPIADLTIELQAARELAMGDTWTLVAPDGSSHRVGEFFPSRDGAEQKLVARVESARGLPSAGIWELVARRAGRDLVLRRFGVAIRCRLGDGDEVPE